MAKCNLGEVKLETIEGQRLLPAWQDAALPLSFELSPSNQAISQPSLAVSMLLSSSTIVQAVSVQCKVHSYHVCKND